jgi:cytochrome-b5 reductase
LLAPLPSSYSGFLLLSQYAPLWEDISSSTTVPQSHLCTVAVETSLTLFPTEQKKVLDPAVFKEFPLTEKTILSHNTAIYRFALPTPNSILGLPIGQHISIAANLDVKDPKTETVTNKEVVRSYTPISSDVDPGYFDLLIKSYPTGNISRHLATLKIGDKMKVKGPKGAMVYTPNMVRHFGMIAGGTGITPMLQVAKAIIRGRSSGDKTQVDLIFANVNEEDILMKQDLDKLTREDSGFRVHYVLNNPPEGWTGGVGFVTGDMIKVRSKDSFVASASELIVCNRNFSPPLPRTSRSSFAAHLPWSAP